MTHIIKKIRESKYRKRIHQIKNISIISFCFGILSIFIPINSALAVCPVCTVAVGAGVGLSRWLGIDDTIAGLWIGGLLVSMIVTTDNWLKKKLKKKKIKFKQRRIVVILAYYLLGIGPLFFLSDVIGAKDNTLWGMDKLLLGIGMGTIVFVGAAYLNTWLKKNNKNKVYFPFQRVVLPVSALTIASGIFYLITK